MLAVFSILVLFTACDGVLGNLGGLGDILPTPPDEVQKVSLQEKIDNAKAGDIIDLSDELLVIDENGSFTITKKLTIKNGDTLLGIAYKFSGVSLNDILQLNGLNKNSKIYPGRKIKIRKL